MQIDDQDDTFLARWLNGTLSEAERIAFEQSESYADFLAIAENAKELTVAPLNKELAWEALDQKAKEKPKAVARKTMMWRAMAAAIALLVLSSLGWYWAGNQSYTTVTGQRQLVNLPDNSSVLLNSRSSLSYNTRFWAQNRKLALEGEAFFTVEPGSNFRVTTQNGQVEVLGTSFNVYDRQQDFEVHCVTGQVRVNAGATFAPQRLLPNEALKYSDGNLRTELFSDATPPNWQNGQSYYQNALLARVLRDLDAQFGLEFQQDGVDLTQRFTGVFLHEDPDQALEMVLAPMGIRYARNGSTVRLFTD